jgi:hypothetical protein
METKDRYYTMGVYVHDWHASKIDMSVEEADIVRSKAIADRIRQERERAL